MLYTEKERLIYEQYQARKERGDLNIAETIAKKYGVSRSRVFEIVKEIDEGIFPKDKFKKKYLEEILDIKFYGKYISRYEDYKKNRLNRNDVKELRNIISDMLKDNFSPNKISFYLKKHHSTILSHIKDIKKK